MYVYKEEKYITDTYGIELCICEVWETDEEERAKEWEKFFNIYDIFHTFSSCSWSSPPKRSYVKYLKLK